MQHFVTIDQLLSKSRKNNCGELTDCRRCGRHIEVHHLGQKRRIQRDRVINWLFSNLAIQMRKIDAQGADFGRSYGPDAVMRTRDRPMSWRPNVADCISG
jgi:hypothetical protein